MSINWQNLRLWNSSQNNAFEELCCQLAAYEPTPAGSTFIRKAPPDAGVECFWKLSNGDEWGWQAKFFISPPEMNQWRQIDDSVKTALEKHPQLTSYTICLPIDRQDPRIDQQKWFMNKWNEHMQKWERWAQQKGISVKFNYWGEHEVWIRLSHDAHRGRYLFWFDKELFSHQWFENRISETVANAGARYTPELNVELPIAHLFHGLGRTSEFYDRLKVLYGNIKKSYSKAKSKKVEKFAENEFGSLRDSVNLLLSILESINKLEIESIDFNSIAKLASAAIESARRCIQNMEHAADEEKKKVAALREQQEQPQEQNSYNRPEEFEYERSRLYELIREITAIEDFSQSSEASLVNKSALLLVGDAGTGKTHLFCDVAKQRVNSGLPTVLLLGGQFNNEEPWSQVIRMLGLSCGREQFLGALEAAAQARCSKTLILIDALNEGEGKKLWIKHLAGMLTTLSRYPWISIAVSVRTSYEKTVIPEGLIPLKLIREIHHGFTDYEYQATKTFFNYFGIERPGVPLLVPEFQNPLFLKLFCQGIKNRNLTKIPPGLQGITAIFDFFVESVNEKLSRLEYLDFDPKSKFVQKAVEKLAEIMANRCSTWIPREEAQVAINTILPRDGYENSLFRHMISEGLLAENRFPIGNDEWEEGIHFAYERFTDHLIAKYLLDKHLDSENPSFSFLPDQPIGSLLKDEWTCWRNRGLIEAFCIQIPERIKKELAEVVPACAYFKPCREAFVSSLIWRDSNAFTGATLQYINEHVIRYEDTCDQFLNALLTVASNPEHPYNADFLHKHLMNFKLAERDAWWSIFLHNQYGEHSAVDRHIDWAWSTDDKSHIHDESVRLCGISLAWFLTTSNRYLRDRATKSLVSLLTNRIRVLRQILQEFLSVNDPYVLERLFAVAYGCAMRSTNKKDIGYLAKDVYEAIFKDGAPPPHILLRDYARGVIEVALHHGVELDIDVPNIKPPYKSEWPSEIPSKEELEKYREWQESMPDKEWARVHLYDSVMGHEDFARYIIGTNIGDFEWTSRRLGKPRSPSREEIYKDFIQSLTVKQKKAWERYNTIRNQERLSQISWLWDQSKRPNIFKYEGHEDSIENCEQSLLKTLDKKKLKIFEEIVIPYLNNPSFNKGEYSFDLSIAQRWIFKRVLDLGWTVERFGRFDRNINRYSNNIRGTNKSERIGKKYQWIAYHEFLARISDNFEFKGDYRFHRYGKYEGPWQKMYVRDIDPSCILKKTEREEWKSNTNTWWFPSVYDTWDSEPDDFAWLKNTEDLPAIEPLVEVTDPQNGSKWLNLESYYKWEQPTPPEEERFETPRREIWYMLKSYIVKKTDMDELFKWAQKQNFIGGWMPESHELTNVFLGEYSWAPAFEYYNILYNYDECSDCNRIPKNVLVSTNKYMQGDGGYDCSIDGHINIFLPAKWLVDGMRLRWNGVEGYLFEEKGDL